MRGRGKFLREPRQLFWDARYLTVIPRPDLCPRDGGPNSFVIDLIQPGDVTLFATTLLMPGDSVHLTRQRPVERTGLQP